MEDNLNQDDTKFDNDKLENKDNVIMSEVVSNKVVELKPKRRIFRKIFLFIIDILFILLAIYFIIAYVNFKKISNDEEPILINKTIEYKEGNHEVKVYGFIYKIVYDKIPGESVVLRLKLWFMKDL